MLLLITGRREDGRALWSTCDDDLQQVEQVLHPFFVQESIPPFSPTGKDEGFLFAVSSCHVVLGSLSALWHLPVDVLVRCLDIARLAVDAAKGISMD
jgi:hypothetical protein